jgi:hypothetical protein
MLIYSTRFALGGRGAARILTSHPEHFTRDEPRTQTAGHLARELHICMSPPVGAIRRKETTDGSEEESDQEVEKGQVSAAYQTTYGLGQRRQIKPMR